MTVRELLLKQRQYFAAGNTLSFESRYRALRRLRLSIQKREKAILSALSADLSKGAFEGYMCEAGLVYAELNFMEKHLKKLMRPQRTRAPLSQFPSRCYSLPCPYGQALIVSPWNYPFQLTMLPLIDCIAAGNTAIVKPSASAPATAAVVQEVIEDAFLPEHAACLTGGREEHAGLFAEDFDFIFFTGGKKTGREVAAAAAKNLTPCLLELGGKSPCVVRKDADIRLAARRIAFGKFLNAGQTCVAPDYVLVHPAVRAPFVAALEEECVRMYGRAPLKNPEYPKLIDRRAFERVRSLILPEKTVFGGEWEESSLKIAPTVMENVSFSDPVMQEEIFGPLLPVLEAESLADIKAAVAKNPEPLALYWFGNKKEAAKAIREISFGGGCINDTVMHLVPHGLGFGGVGESGTGAYHGKRGFFAFSHCKSILEKSVRTDLPFRYLPSTAEKDKTVRKFLR